MMLVGCQSPTELAVTLVIDPSFTPAKQEAAVTLGPTTMPIASADQVLDPSVRAFTVLLPDRALPIAVTVTDTDASGLRLAGSVSAVSVPHQRVTSTLCLGNCVLPPDLAVGDLASADLAGADLAAADLAGADFATPDLTPPPCSGTSRCATAGVLLCENFESGTIQAPWAARVDTGASAVFDSARTCRGSQALHLTTPALGSSQQIASYLFEETELPTSTFYLRAFVYAPAQTWPDPSNTMLQAFQTATPFDDVSFVIETGGFMRNVASAGTFARSTLSAAPFPTDRWVCVEWEIVSATGATGALHTWLDGALLQSAELTSAVTQPSPALGAVAIGIDYQPTTTSSQLDLWIDEIAIDTKPIGCNK
jgi:uncharacterized protein YjbI with pentapeptide repeats